MRGMRAILLSLFLTASGVSLAAEVERQPFLAALGPLMEAADALGSPFAEAERQTLRACLTAHDDAAVATAMQVLDAHTLFVVNINPEQRVKVATGAAKPELHEGGWRQYLVRVDNEAGVTAPLRATSPHAKEAYVAGSPPVTPNVKPPDPGEPALEARWLDLHLSDAPPLRQTLSGLPVEYRLIQLYARDAGKRQATFAFDVGQGTQDLGFRAEVHVLFDCRPAHAVVLRVKDEHGAPCTACFTIRDAAGRVHPAQTKRVAPDFFFHPQVYRADGESLRLPAGSYDVVFSRGPESVEERRQVTVGEGTKELAFRVQRWVDPAAHGWWSGDHHIHAAGCAHYSVPSMGVHAPDMARHCMGEDLKVGANLTWGPCFDYQKQFFTGKESVESRPPFFLRYDVEVSGFGSHRSGHLCLLKLREQMYPGGDSTDHWPTLCLNTLRWAKRQGALCGPAHSGWGLQPMGVDAAERRRDTAAAAARRLPDDATPAFDGIGACEYIVDVTHEVPGPAGKPVPAVDFMSTVDTPAPWELNMWYHTLNAGFRTRISGETDFPCIYGEKVGLGRSYVKVAGPLSYDAWCEGVRAGRCYVSDGHSHLMDFAVDGQAVGEGTSELRLPQAQSVTVTAKVAARLAPEPVEAIRRAPLEEKPYWHLERARVGQTRTVPVEVLVNGTAVARQEMEADGTLRDLRFAVPMEQSGWVALRIFPSSHTNPVFVLVGDRPIRVKRSLEWCLKSVDQCWAQKQPLIDADEQDDARTAYEHARQVYRQRLAE